MKGWNIIIPWRFGSDDFPTSKWVICTFHVHLPGCTVEFFFGFPVAIMDILIRYTLFFRQISCISSLKDFVWQKIKSSINQELIQDVPVVVAHGSNDEDPSSELQKHRGFWKQRRSTGFLPKGKHKQKKNKQTNKQASKQASKQAKQKKNKQRHHLVGVFEEKQPNCLAVLWEKTQQLKPSRLRSIQPHVITWKS